MEVVLLASLAEEGPDCSYIVVDHLVVATGIPGFRRKEGWIQDSLLADNRPEGGKLVVDHCIAGTVVVLVAAVVAGKVVAQEDLGTG